MVDIMDNQTETVLDINKHAAIISVIMADLVDRTFIYSVKKYFENLPDEAKKHQDIEATLEWLQAILMKNINEKKEAAYELKAVNISKSLKMLIDYSSGYSKTYKRELLTALSRDTVVANLEPIVNDIKEMVVDIRTFDSDKKSVKKMVALFDEISHLYQVAQKNKIASSDSNMLIIDPTSKDTYNTLPKVMEGVRTSAANKIKTIPALDMMFGGGISAKTLTLFGAWTGNFKSGTMQNLALYMAKNNSKDAFKLDVNMQPCILFVSLELTLRQLLERDLAWMRSGVSEEELKTLSDEEVRDAIFNAREANGITIPIIYAERLTNKAQWTPASMVESMILELRSSGMQVVAVVVDYLDRMSLDDQSFKGAGTGAQENSLKLKQKAKELRDLAIKMDIIVITAAQLNGSVREIVKRCQPYIKQVDPVASFGSGMFMSSATLETEVETSIYSHLIEIEERTENSSEVIKKQFIAYGLFKDRDGKALPYKKSERDLSMESLERSYRNKLLQNRELRELMGENIKFHVLIPLENWRLSETDYARTIRTYYPSEKGSFISMDDVLNLSSGIDIDSASLDDLE